MRGKVVTIVEDKGYGFIHVPILDDDVFFHQSELTNTYINALKEGQDVKFEITQTLKGFEAVDIKTIDARGSIESRGIMNIIS